MQSKDWRLVYKASGAEVNLGDRTKDFRGEEWEVTGGSPPKTEASTGRVYVKRDGPERGFYPSVMEMEWVPLG
jgi:hypothetical protein